MSEDSDSAKTPPSGKAPSVPVPAPRLGPVDVTERIAAVDTLRGFALLGILAMNIYAFAMPFAAYGNPFLHGGSTGADLATWVVTHLFFDQKFMAIFSMLFGAGLVLMAERAAARGARLGAVYFRRMLWLLVIGAAHAYLVWFGDILFSYAICGMVIYPFHRLSPRLLIPIGIVILSMALPISTWLGLHYSEMKTVAAEVEARLAADETVSEEEQRVYRSWQAVEPMMAPTRDDAIKEIEVYRDGYAGIFRARLPVTIAIESFILVTATLWRAGGLMILGMGLMKLGILSATRSAGFYRRLAALGYGLGLPLAAFSAYYLTYHRFDPLHTMKIGGYFNYVAGISVSLGHIALVILVVRRGVLPKLREKLAAVGRMALTNYLMHSLILTTVFYGYGLGLHGHVNRFAQMGFVVSVWALQLYCSRWWLRFYRFGPFEWLWRSLTYWRRQPMRKTVAPPGPQPATASERRPS